MLGLSETKVDDEINLKRLYSTKLVNSSKQSTLIVRWLGAIFLGCVLSLFLPWQQNIDGKGIVTAFNPQQRPQTIQTLIAGRIEKWKVREGQFVHKGDTIMVISEIKDKYFDPNILSRMNNQIQAKESSLESKDMKVKALDAQIAALRKQRVLSLNKAENKVQQYAMYVTIDSVELIAAKVDVDIAKKQMDRQQKLFDEGLVSLTNLEQRNLKYQQSNAKYISAYNKYNASKNDLLNAQIELSSIDAEYMDKLAKAQSEKSNTLSEYFDTEANIQKLKTEYSNLEIRNNLYIIRAPQDGYIVRAIKQGLGETVKEGEDIITIMPAKPQIAVELHVKQVDMPLAYIGCPVRLQFDGWPAIVFSGWPGASVGTFGGRVVAIDYLPGSSGKFRLLIVPDSTDAPWPAQLRMGTGVQGWAMLHNVTLGYELWRQFNGFPPEFTAKDAKSAQVKKVGKKVKLSESDEE